MKVSKSKVLFIDRWNSSCGNCGKDANWREKTHDTEMGFGGRGEGAGCGIKWECVSSNYLGLLGNVSTMRPDLEPVSYEDIDYS